MNIFRNKKRRLLSLDFGQGFLKIIHLEASAANRFSLLHYGLYEVSPAAANRSQTLSLIGSFLRENSIMARDAFVTISDPDSVVIKSAALPQLPDEEISQALKWQLKSEILFDIDNALLDWQVCGRYTDPDGAQKNEIACMLAKTETINYYIALLKELGIFAVGLSSGPFNLANILAQLKEGQTLAAVLDVGHKSASVSIYKEGKLNFIRSLAFSSDKLTDSLTGSLTTEKGKVELSRQEAEKIKRDYGIPSTEAGMLKGGIQPLQIISLMRPFLEGLAKEIKRSSEYFSSNFQQPAPSLLYITGGGAGLKNLDRHLARELNLEVFQLPLPASVGTEEIDSEKLKTDLNQIISAIGAALAPGSGTVNLLPKEIKMEKVGVAQKMSLRVFGVVLAAVCLFVLFGMGLQIQNYANRLKSAQLHLASIKDIGLLKQKIQSLETLANYIKIGNVPTGGLLKNLSGLVPAEIILSELVLDQPAHSLILKGAASVGKDSGESTLINFIKDIEISPFFKEATLVSSNNLGSIQEFEIRCELAL